MMATEISFSFFAPSPENVRKKNKQATPTIRSYRTGIPSASEGQGPSAKLHSHDRTNDNFSPNKNTRGGGSEKFSPLFVSQRGVWRHHVPHLFNARTAAPLLNDSQEH